MTSNNKPNKRLFIGSLPYKFTEGELLSLFIPEGKIVAVRIIHNQWGKSRGMGYVEFETENDAIRAKEKFHNFHLGDRSIIVDYAQPDPFLTPEGQQRHIDAQEKKPKRHFPEISQVSENQQSKTPIFKKFDKTKSKHVRQTVFESRHFGSRTGSKFAKRNKGK